MGKRLLHDLILINSSTAVLDEVQFILREISPKFNTALVTRAFHTTVDLFDGKYPGFRACNTEYHDLRHTTNTFLATARLVHGAVINGETIPDRLISLSLTSALMHDSGYIQEDHDAEGTGAKYTETHVQRSMEFMQRAGPALGLSEDEIAGGCTMIFCTDLPMDISEISFPSPDCEILGRILAAADLLAQMSDRSYLEKLLFLYRELKEAGIEDFEDEVDLLRKTLGFYNFVDRRLKQILDSAGTLMRSHFTSRWNIPKNLYQEAIDRQKNYLKNILEMPDTDPRDHLRRSGIVKQIRKKYGDND